MEEKKGIKTKICCACKLEKSIKSFTVNNAKPDGYSGKCKICVSLKKPCKTGPRTIEKDLAKDISVEFIGSMTRIDKEDWVNTYKFLEMMGYDIRQNIHEQFCEKHSLPTKKRGFVRNKEYSPKDLGLI